MSEQLFLLVAHPGGALALLGYRLLIYGGCVISAFVYLAGIRLPGELMEPPS